MIKTQSIWLKNIGIKQKSKLLMNKCRSNSFIIALSLLILSSTLSLHSQNKDPVTGAEARMKSWDQHVKLKNSSPYKDLKWRVAGPEFMSGRIETIASHTDEPFTIYAGAGSGSLWKSINHGTTWESIFDDQPTFAMGCIAIAPSDPDILWLGTGEVLMARSSYSGLGVFKSDDAGKTWQHMGLEGSYHVPRIVIDPMNPDIVYAAALGHNYTFNEERGIYKTTDGGVTWDMIFYISEKIGVMELIMDPSDHMTLYATSWERERKAWNINVAGEGNRIYKTTDGGKTWKQLSRGIEGGDFIGRIGLSISPANPNVIYALRHNTTRDTS